MGTLFVEVPLMRLETLLLGFPLMRWGSRGLVVQGQMNSLVTSVLLRVARPDSLVPYSEAQTPRRQLAQAVDASRGEWSAVVGANRRRKSMFEEDRLECRSRGACDRGGEGLAQSGR